MTAVDRTVSASNVDFSNRGALSIIAGPCQLESRDHGMMMAESLKQLSDQLDMPIVFKSSFDKANRTSLKSGRGMGIAGVFIETHEDPDNAPSDGPNMVPLHEMKALLTYLCDLDAFTKNRMQEASHA